MNIQLNVHYSAKQGTRVEKLFVARRILDSRTALVQVITLKIDRLQSCLKEGLLIEYLDDEGDYCILRDDHKSFIEMLQTAKTTEVDHDCCRINIRVTESTLPVAAPTRDTRAPQKSTKCPV